MLKRPGSARPKGPVSSRRPAGMQAINPALYQQIREAVRELATPRPTARAA
ncbi:MAG TPA: hypothetical protein VND93_14355 [Myxococcales bacterium]|nr:hypothetical protein [Myxococcales bacterium]